ncbi:TetR/AcrR family transcriptional regulator [Planomonospora sp. ID67723]|uniref:TetR/AcrR family transcriptional regulator n=1 Tax=Planomonospora sp. ID67723 TaxID=2738134 RepID=UPI001A3541AD|nr:TetR/AcrR family transcriptional regulator [Planomonospora sp. ID67723]MBG0832883.1 TetR/AcrR family transcriptional regulator [Planomonospora sp. ID67723]
MSSTQARILQAAERLIAEHGAGFTMADVARETGVSRQAVYLHFASRASLLMALVRHMDDVDGIRPRCERALAVPDPVEALRAFLFAWLRYAARIRPVASALLASRRDDPDTAAAWEDRMGELREGFLVAARRLGGAGLLRPGLAPETAADLAWAMTSVPVWEQLTIDCGMSAHDAGQHLTDAVTAAIVGS